MFEQLFRRILYIGAVRATCLVTRRTAPVKKLIAPERKVRSKIRRQIESIHKRERDLKRTPLSKAISLEGVQSSHRR